jgi:hypothetical protein
MWQTSTRWSGVAAGSHQMRSSDGWTPAQGKGTHEARRRCAMSGFPPHLGCVPLFDDGTLPRGGIPLVARVALGNISAEEARALLERTRYLSVNTALGGENE